MFSVRKIVRILFNIFKIIVILIITFIRKATTFYFKLSIIMIFYPQIQRI